MVEDWFECTPVEIDAIIMNIVMTVCDDDGRGFIKDFELYNRLKARVSIKPLRKRFPKTYQKRSLAIQKFGHHANAIMRYIEGHKRSEERDQTTEDYQEYCEHYDSCIQLHHVLCDAIHILIVNCSEIRFKNIRPEMIRATMDASRKIIIQQKDQTRNIN